MSQKENHLKKETSKKIRLRLLISIPMILSTFTFGSGFMALNLMKGFSSETLNSDDLFPIASAILLMAALAGVVGIMVAHAITYPLKRLTTSAKKIIMEAGSELEDFTASNELDAISTIFDKTFLSINKFIKDSQILDSLPEGIITLNLEGTITDLNKKAADFLQCEPQQVKGSNIKNIFPPSDENNQSFFDLIDKGQKDEKAYFQHANLSLTGKRTIPVMMQTSSIGKEGLKNIMIILKDPEEVKLIRNHIQKSEQLAILGTMATGIAHELRNPLGAIRGLTELIAEDIPPSDPKKQYTENMLKEIDRLNHLVEDTFDLAQKPLSRIEPTDINQILSQIISTARYNFPNKDIKITRKQQPDLPLCQADSERLTQAFLNILINAFEATTDGGKIEIRSQKSEAENIIVTISDSGSGLAHEDSSHIFDLFYTTKEKGTGLGLSITKNIIDAHGGNIEAENTSDQGTTFNVTLPIECQSV